MKVHDRDGVIHHRHALWQPSEDGWLWLAIDKDYSQPEAEYLQLRLRIHGRQRDIPICRRRQELLTGRAAEVDGIFHCVAPAILSNHCASRSFIQFATPGASPAPLRRPTRAPTTKSPKN